MSSEEKFKDLLKEKLESKEFPFNPSNWEKAQDMIDASRATKRKLVPFILLCVGLFLSGGLFFYLLDNTILQPKSTIVNKVSKQPATGETTKPLIENTQNSSPEKITKSEPTKVQEKGVEQITEPKTTDKNNPDVNKNIPKKATEPITNSKKYEIVKEQPKVVETKSAAFATTIKRSHTNPPVVEKTADTKNEIEITYEDIPPYVKPLLPTQPLVKSPEEPKANIEEPVKKPEPANNPPSVTENVPLIVKEEQQLPIVEKAEINRETSREPEKNIPVPTENKTDVSIPVTTNPVAKSENPQDLAKNDSTPRKVKHDPKNIFSVEAGLNYHAAWENDGNKEADGINPMIGINYLRAMSSKIKLSLGVHYTTVDNLGNYSHTSKETHYSFGGNNDLTVITPVKIHYLLAPLRLHYFLNEKNSIGVGYTFAYLLTVNNTIENYTQKLNANSDRTTSKTKGYSEGFNPFDSQLSVFYRRRLFSDLSANTEFFYGLNDIKDNSFFASNYFDRNMGVKFTLIYNLFKK